MFCSIRVTICVFFRSYQIGEVAEHQPCLRVWKCNKGGLEVAQNIPL